jgi:hypothetical protein
MGVIPTALSQLTGQVTNGQGQVAGPFCASEMTSKRMRAGALRMRLRRRGFVRRWQVLLCLRRVRSDVEGCGRKEEAGEARAGEGGNGIYRRCSSRPFTYSRSNAISTGGVATSAA